MNDKKYTGQQFETFNILDVATIKHMTPVKHWKQGRNYAYVCPGCGDTRGKFSVKLGSGQEKDGYRCFVCNIHGGKWDLWKMLSEQDGSISAGEYDGPDAYTKMACDVFRAMRGETSFADAHYATVKAAAEQEEEAEPASDEVCSRANYTLLKMLPLKEAHKQDLLRRGLSEEEIKRFRFKSIPDNTSVVRKLLKAGVDLNGVPGFYKNRRDQWTMALPGSKDDNGKWHPDSGYFCPAFDGETNLLLRMQERMDVPKDGKKYTWLTSAGRKNGVSSGTVATYLPGNHGDTVIITEGILKATVIYCLLQYEVTVIGVPGISNLKCLESYLERIPHDAVVFEAYDMERYGEAHDEKDERRFKNCLEYAGKLSSLCESYGHAVHHLRWDYDETGVWKQTYKGLDDFLLPYEHKDLFVKYLLRTTKQLQDMRSYLKQQ